MTSHSVSATGEASLARTATASMSLGRPSSCSVASFFDVARTAANIAAGGYKRVALQFPDELLPDAFDVIRLLRAETASAGVEYYVLGDTSYGSYSVDEVAAQHVAADYLVHYGNAYLTPTERLPVEYVFGRSPVDPATFVDALKAQFFGDSEPVRGVLVFHEARYDSAMPAVRAAVAAALPRDAADRVFFATPRVGPRGMALGAAATEGCGSCGTSTGASCGSSSRPAVEKDADAADASVQRIVLSGYEFTLPRRAAVDTDADVDVDATRASSALEECALCFLGRSGEQLTSLILQLPSCPAWVYTPGDVIDTDTTESTTSSQAPAPARARPRLRRESIDGNRWLMRRYVVVEKLREARVIGLVVGTLAATGYMQALRHARRLINESGRKAYTFVVGKVNVPKLGNFMEIDAFVLVAAAEAAILDSKEYLKPIATLYELAVALDSSVEWTGNYVTDFTALLPGLSASASSASENDGATVESKASEAAGARKGAVEPASALIKLGERGLVEFKSPAAVFLKERDYQGLEVRLGQTEVVDAAKGQFGIASGYDGEGR